MRIRFDYSLVDALLATCFVIAACLALTGCGRNERGEVSTRSGLTTGSISPFTAVGSARGFVVVQAHDTLHSIARRHNATVYDLMVMNELSTTRISAGQRLYLPSY